jgi:hypothetical protein
MKVRCVRIFNGLGKPVQQSSWLTIGKVYPVLSLEFGIENGTRLRLIGDGQNGVAIFRWDQFEVVTSLIPPMWIIVPGPKSTVDLAPEPWTQPGFWVRYYDGDLDAVDIFKKEARKIMEADPRIAAGSTMPMRCDTESINEIAGGSSSQHIVVCPERVRVLDCDYLELRGVILSPDAHGYQESFRSKGFHHRNRLHRNDRIGLAI